MILPTVILPGYFAGWRDYTPLSQLLQQQGIPTAIVPLVKRDWLPTVGGRSMVPILRLLHQTVEQILTKEGGGQVNLIGHSAGGWIGRIYLGEQPYCIHGDVDKHANLWGHHSRIATLVTLGTPHSSGERWTRKNLDFVNQNYPGAFYPDVSYVCVAGKAVYGERRLQNWFTYSSYQLTCGHGQCWGDGITPIVAAHLTGAHNLTIEGAMHSPSASLWYGSPQLFPRWGAYLR